MARTTIRISDQLLAQVKKKAADSRRTIAAVIEDALRETLLRREPPQKRLRLPVFKPKRPGLRAGVDLNDTAALLDLMDDIDPRRR